MRQAGRILSVAVAIAVAVNTDGVTENVGSHAVWCEQRRGFRGVKLMISDAQLGYKRLSRRSLPQRGNACRVHFVRKALAFANKGQRQMVLALIITAFAQDTAGAAHDRSKG